MNPNESLFRYTLRLGDHALIMGHRLSEWCSRGPILEEDLALTNMALDHIGRAQAFLKYAGEIEQKGRSEDDLAYKRGEREFYNYLITELPNGDFAMTIARQLLLSAFELHFFEALSQSSDATLSAIAAKTLKEVRYHFTHARDWCLRLGKGTNLSHDKLQYSFNVLWMYTGEFFEMNENDKALLVDGISVDTTALRTKWLQTVQEVMTAATMQQPVADYMQSGSAQGIHTEYLGHILSEMQYLQRAYPDATW